MGIILGIPALLEELVALILRARDRKTSEHGGDSDERLAEEEGYYDDDDDAAEEGE